MTTIAYAFSPDWIKYWKVSCYSLLKNSITPMKIYIFTDELNVEQKKEINFLRDSFQVEIVHIAIVGEYFYGEHLKRFTKYSCYRLLVSACIQEDKVIYLDCDTIVLQPLDELYNIDLGNSLVGGVVDGGVKLHEKLSIGITDEEPYFNAGVILLNCKAIRDEALTQVFIERVNNTRSKWIDQDCINYVARGRKLTINTIYNVCTATGIGMLKVKNMVIIHYAGNKRYNNENDWVSKLPLDKIWDEHRIALSKLT